MLAHSACPQHKIRGPRCSDPSVQTSVGLGPLDALRNALAMQAAGITPSRELYLKLKIKLHTVVSLSIIQCFF